MLAQLRCRLTGSAYNLIETLRCTQSSWASTNDKNVNVYIRHAVLYLQSAEMRQGKR